MDYQLTEKQINKFKEAFCLLDEDGDGIIWIKQLETIMQLLGQDPSEAELEDMLNELERDGLLTFPDFLRLITKRINDNIEMLNETTKNIVKKNNGYISAAELKHALACLPEKITDEEADKMIKEADTNGSKQINYDHFVKLMLAR